MNKFKELGCTIISDLMQLKKETAIYTIIYITATFFSNRNMVTDNTNLMTSISVIGMIIIQIVSAIHFQRAYAKQIIPFIEFTPTIKVFLHTYRIVLLQALLFVPIIVIFILTAIILSKIVTISALMAMLLKLGLIGMVLAWAARLVFIQMLLVYKRDTFKMKDIVRESMEILQKNLVIVLPLLLLMYMPILYMTYKIFANTDITVALQSPYYSWSKPVFPALVGYISSLFYVRLVIEHQKDKMSRFLPFNGAQ